MLQEENILQNVVEPQFQDIFVSLLAWYCSIPIINQMPYTPWQLCLIYMNGSSILHSRLVVCCSTLVILLEVHCKEIVFSYYLGDGISSSSVYSNNNAQFSTFDNDNDAISTTNNAATWRGAWWYHDGHTSNLNGEYGNNNHGQGINWIYFKGWTNSLSGTRMMLRMPWPSKPFNRTISLQTMMIIDELSKCLWNT